MKAVVKKSITVSKPVHLLVLLSLWLVFSALGTGSVYADSVVVNHVVQNGDNLTSIATQYGTTVSRICQENNISSGAVLRVGQVLRITRTEKAAPTSTPQPAAPPPAESPAQPVSAPVEGNDSPTPTSQPTATSTPAPAATALPVQQSCAGYAQSGETRITVRGGDTLSGLASRYNTTVPTIKTRNCLNSDTLRVGQLLIVPIGSTSATATPTHAGQQTDPTPTRAPATATPTRWPTATPRPNPTPAPTANPSGSWLDRLLGRNG